MPGLKRLASPRVTIKRARVLSPDGRGDALGGASSRSGIPSVPAPPSGIAFRLTQGFHVYENINDPRHHPGLDVAPANLSADVPVAVRSVNVPLKVERVGYMPGGYGYYLYGRDPEGNQLRFGHFGAPVPFSPGETVAPGQMIDIMGSTGRSSGRHLHFEVRRPGGGYYDAGAYLSRLQESIFSLVGGARRRPVGLG